MKIAIAIETMDRRTRGGENFLDRTILNMLRSGVFKSPHFHSLNITDGTHEYGYDPTWLDHYQGGPWIVNPAQGRTRQQNGLAAIAVGWANTLNRGADFIIKLEDDLDFCDDFLGSVVNFLAVYPHQKYPCNMFTFASSYERIETCRYQEPGESVLGPGESFPRVRQWLAKGHRFHRQDTHLDGALWAGQALGFYPDQARVLLEAIGQNPTWKGRSDKGHDQLLGHHARFVGACIPSLVQHIGVTSTLATPFFEFPWPGREWSFQ